MAQGCVCGKARGQPFCSLDGNGHMLADDSKCIARAFAQGVRTEGGGDLDAIAFIQGMSPVARQHVNMFGSFEFNDDEQEIGLDALAAQYADSVFWSNATQLGQGDLFN